MAIIELKPPRIVWVSDRLGELKRRSRSNLEEEPPQRDWASLREIKIAREEVGCII